MTGTTCKEQELPEQKGFHNSSLILLISAALPDTYTDERSVIPLHHYFLLGITIIYRFEKQ
jgi:hypothetical protein